MMARQEAEKELRAQAPNMPHRFFVPKGEMKQIIIVDDRPSFFRSEHNLQDKRSQRWDVYVPCLDEVCVCPACQSSQRPAYFAMYLTIIDESGYENSKGEWVEWSKKLMVVKLGQQKKIMRLMERNGGGSLRGMVLEMTRDNDKGAAIGDPEFVELIDDAALAEFVTSYEDKEGVVHEVYGDEPFDYDALFPPMNEDQLRALLGGEAPSGSRSADDRALGRGRSRGAPAAEEDGSWESNAPARRVATRRSAAPVAEPEEVEYEEVPAAPARRAAPARPAAPAARAPARRPAPAIHPDDLPDAGSDDGAAPWAGEDEVVEEAPQRPARRAPAAPAAPARAAVPARRPAPAAPAAAARPARRPAPEPEEAAPAARPDMAARRAAIRR